MATTGAGSQVYASELDRRQRLQECVAALNRPGWQQRLAPLAQHITGRRLVRARSDAGAALRHLDLHMLREALSTLLRHDWEVGSVIYDLVVKGTEASVAAVERGVSLAVLTEQLRHAVQRVASAYEARAYAGEVSEPGLAGAVRARLDGKRR